MTRQDPLQYGEYYHIYNRGNNRELLFREDRNYPYFMKLYRKYIAPIAETFCYCLLPNHFHILVRIRDFEDCKEDWQSYSHIYPSRAFSKLFSTYTKAFNKSYNRTGSLFEKPFKRKLIEDDRYFTSLVVYIHRNPQRHGYVSNFKDWSHSSYKVILSDKPTLLMRDTVLNWFGGRKGFEEIHFQEGDLKIMESAAIEELV